MPESQTQLVSISLDIVHRPYIRRRALSAPSKLPLARAEARQGECGNAHDLYLDKEVASSTSPKTSVANDHVGLITPEAVQKVSDALRIDNVMCNEPGSASSNCDHRIPALSPTQGATSTSAVMMLGTDQDVHSTRPADRVMRNEQPSMTATLNEELPIQVEANERVSLTFNEPPEVEGGLARLIPEVILDSQVTLIPDFWTMTLVVISISVTGFTVYYSWNASIALNPSQHFLWFQPNVTVFTVNILSYIATVFVKALIDATCDHIRWRQSSREKGMSVLSFLALSSATSLWGLVHLLFSPVPRIQSTSQSMSHRLWSLQRYVTLEIKSNSLDCFSMSFRLF